MNTLLRKNHCAMIVSLLLAALLSACATTAPPPAESVTEPGKEEMVIPVNLQTYTSQIIQYPGPAVVVFYHTEYWQSVDMLKRIEWLAEKYPGQARFAKFHWQTGSDDSRLGLEMLPTVLLYQSGREIDRIKGIPPEANARAKWNDDIDLWFLKNALNMKGSEYSGDFTYKFNNDYKLEIGNY